MDPGIVLVAIAPQPAEITAQSAVFTGSLLPIVVPVSWLPIEARARWFLQNTTVPLADRIAAALDARFDDEAWRLLARSVPAPAGDPRLDLTLLGWQRTELQRLQIAETNTYALVVKGATNDHKQYQTQATAALSDVRDMLEHIGWPRWSGAVLIVPGNDAFDALARDRESYPRPVLPLLRFAGPNAGETLREQFAASLCGLALDLCAPPDGGWPAWLRTGLQQVAKAKARGEGPSPLQMLAVRQASGHNGLLECLRSKQPRPDVAMALCAPLAHSKRRHLLPNLFDLLRHGSDNESALKIAYGLTAERLLTDR
jgi:hypothetical protein